MNPKFNYFLSSMKKSLLWRGFLCPSCGCARSTVVSRKWLFTSLRRCSDCNLLFRAPTTTPNENAKFYQNEYQEGFTTEMPTAEAVEKLKHDLFIGSPKDFSGYLNILKALDIAPGSKLCDFGCSWGYGSWQFMRYGLEVQAFEIGSLRAEFARNQLNVNVVSNLDELRPPFDVFFSSHVLEHVPSVRTVIDVASKLLQTGGYFIAATPNGSAAYRATNKHSWQLSWGLKHPNLIDDQFYKKAFNSAAYLIASSPYDYDGIRRWAQKPSQVTMGLDGSELLLIIKK